MDKYLIGGWQRKHIFHAYWSDMDIDNQIDKASGDKELDYGLSEDSNWGLKESTGLSFMGMEPPSMTKTDHKTPSKRSPTRSPSRLQDNMITPEHRENDEAKN